MLEGVLMSCHSNRNTENFISCSWVSLMPKNKEGSCWNAALFLGKDLSLPCQTWGEHRHLLMDDNLMSSSHVQVCDHQPPARFSPSRVNTTVRASCTTRMWRCSRWHPEQTLHIMCCKAIHRFTMEHVKHDSLSFPLANKKELLCLCTSQPVRC